MDTQSRGGTAASVKRDAGRLPVCRKAFCLILSCLIAVPFGGVALSARQANAQPSGEQEASEPAVARGDVSASATIEVRGEADGVSGRAVDEALHMPTFEELAGGGVPLAFPALYLLPTAMTPMRPKSS